MNIRNRSLDESFLAQECDSGWAPTNCILFYIRLLPEAFATPMLICCEINQNQLIFCPSFIQFEIGLEIPYGSNDYRIHKSY